MAQLSVHPSASVLELAELVVVGALPRLPVDAVSALSGAAPGAREALAGVGLLVEDAEGTPVVAVRLDGSVAALRPFTQPPLRARRRTPEQVRAELAQLGGRVLAVPVAGPLTVGDVQRATEAARQGGARLLWLALVGSGRTAAAARRLPPEALLRAVRVIAARTGGIAVPVALPIGHDELLPQIATAFGAHRLIEWPATPQNGLDELDELDTAFAVEVALAARPSARRGLTVFLTGLSGSGKSTIARGLTDRLLDDGARSVTLLDGDVVRRLLSHGLGFSRADRDLNIRRIGFVAAEVARHGGLAVCAPIAPYAAVREEVRAMVEGAGGDLVLVYVATPLAECERRDRKGLYAAARRGEVAEFTGVSAPYEPPTDADLVLDTTGTEVDVGVQAVWRLLTDRGYLAR